MQLYRLIFQDHSHITSDLFPPPKVFPHDSSKSLVNYHLYITEFVPMSLPTSSLL